ncbi:hypothetical protein F5B22DRAFT_651711 [Xylaria bambusicola]|uniref:uncharacterized protein n=1 Tax=Xylaria bambusicola TaxID=326684 RepID=UPI00200879AD|nr:uncharacterized protein F5B22DRAFT_651711 [Xylaria bambusicola]KAI0505454.1 hypothetical protein F5B22DRAFT_651711 [Xylaria bambusicola]
MEGVGAAASIFQLATAAVLIIQAIHDILVEAREGLTHAFQRTAELKSLQTILDLIKSSQPSSPDSLQGPLRIVHGHLHELHELLSKVRDRPRTPIFLRLWTVRGLIKTENKIIEGLDNLERAKSSLVLHLSATQRQTLDKILEKMNEQETKRVHGSRELVLDRSQRSSRYGSSPRVEEIVSPTEKDTGYALVPRQQGHIMTLRNNYSSPAAPGAAHSKPEEENATNAPHGNAGHRCAASEWNITGSTIQPPTGSDWQ